MKNRRQAPRYRIDMLVEFVTEHQVVAGQGKDLSLSGIKLSVPAKLQQGTNTTVHLFLITSEPRRDMYGPVILHGKIVWVAPQQDGTSEAGFHFDAVSEEQGEWLGKFLEHGVGLDQSVLIVEDSPTMRQLIRLALRHIPALTALEVDNGAEAIRTLEQRPVDVVLLDLNMPIMDGFTFLEHWATLDERERPAVIVVSTKGDTASIERAKTFNVTAFVTKPVQALLLAEQVQRVLSPAGT